MKLTMNEVNEIIKFQKAQNEAIQFEPGTKVKMNYKNIICDVNYVRKSQKYKDFVEQNKDHIFTVNYEDQHLEKKIVAYLEEAPEWLFYTGDLKAVDNG